MTADHLVTLDVLDTSVKGHRVAVVIHDVATKWTSCYPRASRSAENTYESLADLLASRTRSGISTLITLLSLREQRVTSGGGMRHRLLVVIRPTAGLSVLSVLSKRVLVLFLMQLDSGTAGGIWR